MSLFDKFQNTQHRLGTEVQATDVPSGPILTAAVAAKLQQRQEQMRQQSSAHQPKQPAAAAAAAVAEDDTKNGDDDEESNHHHHGSDSDDAGAATGIRRQADEEQEGGAAEESGGGGFLQFGGGGGGQMMPQKSEKSTTVAIAGAMAALNKKAAAGARSTEDLLDESGAELFMAPVGALTFVKATASEGGNDDDDGGNSNNSSFSYRGERARLVPVTCYVPLWAAHRFFPQHTALDRALSNNRDNSSVSVSALIASTNFAAASSAQSSSKTSSSAASTAAAAAASKLAATCCGYSPIDAIALHQEIEDFIEWVRPTEGELLLRRFIEAQVCGAAKKLFPACVPSVYGSMTTGLLLPGSDIDITLTNIDSSTHSVEDVLLQLAREISARGLCDGVAPQTILKTRVPLVKYRSKLAPIDIDVSVSAFSAASGGTATSSGQLNTEYVIERLRNFPEARPLIVLLKYFLQQRDLNEPFRGGAGSYAATLLVLSFLQHHKIYTTACDQRASYGLGRLFVDLIVYYGTLGFQPMRTGISLRVGATTTTASTASGGVAATASSTAAATAAAAGGKKPHIHHHHHHGHAPQPLPCFWDRDGGYSVPLERRAPGQMMIEDPTCPDNNAASSLRLFQFIQNALEGAFMMLTARTPALHSLLAPAFLYPDATHSLYVPPAGLFASKGQVQIALNVMQPHNPLTVKRPTLLSRILHADVELVRRRAAAQSTFARLQAASMTAEGKMFAEVVAQTRQTKMFSALAEVKTSSRYDMRGKKSEATGEKIRDPNAGVLLPRHPFPQGYSCAAHIAAFEKEHAAELSALKKQPPQHPPQQQQPQQAKTSPIQRLQSDKSKRNDSQTAAAVGSFSQKQQQQQQQQQDLSTRKPHHDAVRRQRTEEEEAPAPPAPAMQNRNVSSSFQNNKSSGSLSTLRSSQPSKKMIESDDDVDGDDGNAFSSWQRAK